MVVDFLVQTMMFSNEQWISLNDHAAITLKTFRPLLEMRIATFETICLTIDGAKYGCSTFLSIS